VRAYALRAMTPDNVVVTRHVSGYGVVGFADFARRCGDDGLSWCMPEFERVLEPGRVAERVRAAIRAAAPS
jgi:hypothetical protein